LHILLILQLHGSTPLQMFLTEVFSGTLAPGAHEIVVKSATNYRACQRNDAGAPLFHDLDAGPRGDALNYFWNKALHHLASYCLQR